METEYLSRMIEMSPETLGEMMDLYGHDVWNYAYYLTKKHTHGGCYRPRGVYPGFLRFLHISAGTVKSRLFRARKKVRELMREDAYE